MISALYRYPKSLRRTVARAWGHRSTASRTRKPDADTLRRRALHDARGQVLREGCTYTALGITPWRVVRSVRGRTNQVDILWGTAAVCTCGPRRLPATLNELT
jgi:hypothetical protein